jgi:predicted nucleic acid-binding protein
MRVVSDTGPILHLREADSLALLQPAGSTHIPPSVEGELLAHDPRWDTERPGWVQVSPLTPAAREEALGWMRAGLLDLGEAEALALAAQLSADWFLTDDTAARMIAQHQGLEVHGSLGVVLWAAVTGALDRSGAERALQALADSSLWISAKVLAEARAALEQICSAQ